MDIHVGQEAKAFCGENVNKSLELEIYLVDGDNVEPTFSLG